MEKTFFYSTLFEYGYSSKEVQNYIEALKKGFELINKQNS
jgi:hypothetical protein